MNKPQLIQTFKASTEPTKIKEPKYLYLIAFDKNMTGGRFSLKPTCNKKEIVIGKIKLEQDDE